MFDYDSRSFSQVNQKITTAHGATGSPVTHFASKRGKGFAAMLICQNAHQLIRMGFKRKECSAHKVNVKVKKPNLFTIEVNYVPISKTNKF